MRARRLPEAIERWRLPASKVCGVVAALFLVAMMLLTVADVVLRGVFDTPLRGVYELVELLLACTFFFALPAVFLRDENIVVNVVDGLAPQLAPRLQRLANIVTFVALAMMVWCGWLAARDAVVFDDVTADLGLSRKLHWTALLIGLFGAAVAAFVMCLRPRGPR